VVTIKPHVVIPQHSNFYIRKEKEKEGKSEVKGKKTEEIEKKGKVNF